MIDRHEEKQKLALEKLLHKASLGLKLKVRVFQRRLSRIPNNRITVRIFFSERITSLRGRQGLRETY